MYRIGLIAVLAVVSVGNAADLANLPANTWVEIKYTTKQPNDPDEKGKFARQGWNKLIYDPDGKRVLFYDRWVDKKHGGWTIYGNCLFGFDPAAETLTPIKIDNWTKMEPKGGGYRTLALPQNEAEPTPAPRHVYHAFDYVPDLKAVFICNGANQTILNKDGKLVGHDLCDGAWRFDLKTGKWAQLRLPGTPPNMLDDAMAYCPDMKSMIYAGANRQIWVLDLAKNAWRKAKQSPPARAAAGQTIFYDPTQRQMLIIGGGRLEGPLNEAKSPTFRELYAFDPKTEEVRKLSDCPLALYEGHLAFDRKHQLFIAATAFAKGNQPAGMVAYDPKKDAWHEIKPANAIPRSGSWFGWLQLCYDAHHDCLIAKVDEKFYVFRLVPSK